MTPAPPDPSLPSRLRAFHQRLPLAGTPPNALLSLPGDRDRDVVTGQSAPSPTA